VRWPLLFVLVLAPLRAGSARADQTLTLPEAIRLARSHHPTVDAQRAQVTIQRGRSEQALANLLPFFTGSFAYQPQTPNLVITPPFAQGLLFSTGSDTVIDTSGAPVSVNCRTPGVGNCAPIVRPTSWALQNFWSMGFGLSWTAWDWGASIYNFRSARELGAAAIQGIRTVQRNVALDVKLAFFAVIAADAQLIVAQDAIKTYRLQLEQVRAFHDTGLRTGIDVATSESSLAAVTITLARAISGRETARAQLSYAIGDQQRYDWRLVADASLFELHPEDLRRSNAPVERLIDVAFDQRTEPRQLELQAKSNLSAMRSARGLYLPQLTLDLGPSWAGLDFSSLTGNFVISAAIGYPASGFSPLQVHGLVRAAEGNLAVTRAQARSTHDAIRQETTSARALLAAACESLLAARKFVEAAARQRELAQGRYQTGIGNIIELTDAVFNDINARFQLIQAQLDLASARARLQHALGEDDV
jgi:outer membrane protein